MLMEHEKTEIYRGIYSVIFNLKHLPIDDVAYFLVEFNPKLADELATSISQQIFDKTEGKKHD